MRNRNLFRSILVLVVLVFGVGLLAVACGDDDDDAAHVEEPTATEVVSDVEPTSEPTATAEPTEEPAVNLVTNEWSITTDTTSVLAGESLYVATNEGTIPHEIVYLRTDRPVDDLPVGADNKVNRFADGIEDLAVIRTDALVPGATVQESFDLPAGNYALICNVPGHYEAGMFVAFVIE